METFFSKDLKSFIFEEKKNSKFFKNIASHAASNLTKTTYIKGFFWNIFMNFWVWDTKKIWKDFGEKPMVWMIIGQFRPFYNFVKFKKSEIQYFWANLATFFFKIRFWAKLVLEPLKMVFLTLFRS